MKWSLVLLLLLTGCATSTVESRRNERIVAYQSLDPDQRALIDQRQIRKGMTEDAVYIAWGNPDQILQGEDSGGAITTWIYQGSYLEEHRVWRHRPVRYGRRGIYYTSYPDSDYYSRSYVSAEVIFENGVVKSWRTLPRPR